MLGAVLLLFLAICAVLAWTAIAQPGPLWRKWLALCALALSVPVALVAVHELTGRPKPIELEWIHDLKQGARVVAYKLVEDEAIYLWLILPGETAPRAYSLPWNRDSARDIQDADALAQELHTEMEMTMEEDPDNDTEFDLSIRAVTLPALQDKPYEEDNSFTYERDADD
jgi:hypothetical protein